jgi:phage regulator Rha-like protein
MNRMTMTMNEMKTIGADIVTTAGPMLTDMMKGLGDVVHTLADAWNGLDEGQQQTIIKMAAVAAAIGPIASGTGRLVTGVGNVISVGSKLAPMIAGATTTLGPLLAAAGPFLIGGAVIAGVIAGGVAIYKNWDTIKEKLGELKEHFTEKWDSMKENVGEGADFIKEIGSKRISEVKQAFEENGGGIKGTMAATWQVLTTQFKTGFDIMDGITGGKLSDIKNAFFSKFNELKDAALTWGRDMIANLVSGITSKLKDVKDAANGIGNAIKERLHFSEPDVGPLSDFHTWMPDMMKGLSDGMIQNLGEVENAANQVAGAIAQPMQTNNYGGFSIVVNGADGQSAREIADEVEARIADKIARQEAVWA